MRWRLILEEYGISLTYVKGTTNIVADALSRLSRLDDINFHACVPNNDLAKLFLNERADDALIYPLDLVLIDKEQQKDTALLRKLQAGTPNLQTKPFVGVYKSSVRTIWSTYLKRCKRVSRNGII